MGILFGMELIPESLNSILCHFFSGKASKKKTYRHCIACNILTVQKDVGTLTSTINHADTIQKYSLIILYNNFEHIFSIGITTPKHRKKKTFAKKKTAPFNADFFILWTCYSFSYINIRQLYDYKRHLGLVRLSFSSPTFQSLSSHWLLPFGQTFTEATFTDKRWLIFAP